MKEVLKTEGKVILPKGTSVFLFEGNLWLRFGSLNADTDLVVPKLEPATLTKVVEVVEAEVVKPLTTTTSATVVEAEVVKPLTTTTSATVVETEVVKPLTTTTSATVAETKKPHNSIFFDPTIGFKANCDKIASCKQLKTVKAAALSLGLNLATDAVLVGGLNVVKDYYIEQIKQFFATTEPATKPIIEAEKVAEQPILDTQIAYILNLCNTTDKMLIPKSDNDQSISEESSAVTELRSLRPELNKKEVTDFLQTFFDTPSMTITEATALFLRLTAIYTTPEKVAELPNLVYSTGQHVSPNDTHVGMYVSVYWGKEDFPKTAGWLQGKVIELVEGLDEDTNLPCKIPVIEYADGDIHDFNTLYPVLYEDGKETLDKNGNPIQFLAGTQLKLSDEISFENEKTFYI